eukprot:TRINITY_DN14958_c0_g1_i10.p2 TRINITY_DN14958_c0_g1~~TRINITY_DN14958_c0_g1_i10.p2  ORF type:complete len:104 (-),score=12.81 TRINITY_DN14958_c0_g1_i10:1996-2307(-)
MHGKNFSLCRSSSLKSCMSNIHETFSHQSEAGFLSSAFLINPHLKRALTDFVKLIMSASLLYSGSSDLPATSVLTFCVYPHERQCFAVNRQQRMVTFDCATKA